MGGLSLLALCLNFIKNTKVKLVSFFILGLGVASLLLIQKVGTTGGEIRHTEIRADSANSKVLPESSTLINSDKDHEDK